MISVTNFTAHKIRHKGEINPNPSQTIPGQSITPQELLRRYATGQPLGLRAIEAVYDEKEEVPEFYKMDKLERLHLMQETAHNVQELKQNLNAYKKREQRQAIEKKQAEDIAKAERKTTNSAAENDEQRRQPDTHKPKQSD